MERTSFTDEQVSKLTDFFLGSNISQKEKEDKQKMLFSTLSFFKALNESIDNYIRQNPEDSNSQVIAKFKEITESRISQESFEKFQEQMEKIREELNTNDGNEETEGFMSIITNDGIDIIISVFRTVIPNIFGLMYLMYYEKQRIMRSIIIDLQGNPVVNPTSLQYFLHIIDMFMESGLHITYSFITFLTSDMNRRIVITIFRLSALFIATLLESLDLENEEYRQSVKMFFEGVLTPILDAPIFPPVPKPSVRTILRSIGMVNETFATAKEWANRNRDIFLPTNMPIKERNLQIQEIDLEQGRIDPIDVYSARLNDLREKINTLAILSEEKMPNEENERGQSNNEEGNEERNEEEQEEQEEQE